MYIENYSSKHARLSVSFIYKFAKKNRKDVFRAEGRELVFFRKQFPGPLKPIDENPAIQSEDHLLAFRNGLQTRRRDRGKDLPTGNDGRAGRKGWGN